MTTGRRVKFVLAYDGTDFCGWQSQPQDRTVQDEFEQALGKILGKIEIRTRAAGRTDSGVHAEGQVADAWIDSNYRDAELQRRLNRLLPDDVRVQKLVTVPDHFHARFGVKEKTYRYQMAHGAVEDPLQRRWVWHLRKSLNTDRLHQTAERFLGTKDYSSFASATCTKVNRVRTITQSSWVECGSKWDYRVTADGFMTYMVRNMVGSMVRFAQEDFELSQWDAWFEKPKLGAAGPTAPARGLFLEEVVYDMARKEGNWCNTF